MKPTYLTFACGDAGILAEVAWSRWSAVQATGRGEVQINQCQPSCAGGTRKSFPASFTAFLPAREGGRVYFREIVVHFLGERPGSKAVVTCALATPSIDGGCVNEMLA